MDLDFLSLKMVVVCGHATQRVALRGAAGMAPVPIDVVEFGCQQTAAAQDLLGRGAVDILFIDGELPPTARNALVRTVRSVNKERTFVILMGTAEAGTRDHSIDDLDADVVLETPIDILKACALVERCVRARLPNRVLVVDDSATVRSIVRKMMRASRFALETEETDEGATALDLVRSGRFDIVFLDCNMPGLDGFATLTEIKRSHPRVETVMMTATRDHSIAERARAAGAKGFLFKPFFPKDIDAVLHGLFGLNVPKAARA